MASKQEFVEYIAGQLSDAGTVTYRKMFGDYGMYLDGKIFALICDNQLFVKCTDAGRRMAPELEIASPYEGAKGYFLVEEVDDRKFLTEFVTVTCGELPPPKKKKKKSKRMIPTREEAEALLKDAEKYNPGAWGNHSRVAAHCAESIARACGDLDPEKAYILGLLHDIGRKFGVRHLGHVSDGYSYMMSLGYDEAARICLTHSFHNQTLHDYIGKFDTTEEELELIRKELETVVMDEYDRLIQLCDSLAGAEGIMDMEARMEDVKRRYGSYPQEKWDANLRLKKHFEEKAGRDIYCVVGKDTWEGANE